VRVVFDLCRYEHDGYEHQQPKQFVVENFFE